jgi:hypothetical protein
MRNDTLAELIRYQNELKNKVQETDNLVLQGGRDLTTLDALKELVSEEEVLLRYLEVESSRKPNEVKAIYAPQVQTNLIQIGRFRSKIREHREYISALFGPSAPTAYHDPFQVAQTLRLTQQNQLLQNQRGQLLENEYLQREIGVELAGQGESLGRGVRVTREVRGEAEEAEGTVGQIRRAVLKRRIVFYSAFGLAGAAVLWVMVRRVFA